MSERDKITLVARYLSGECTDEEKKLIQSRMQKDRMLLELIETMQKVWNVTETPPSQPEIDIAWQRLKSIIESQTRTAGLRTKLKISWRLLLPQIQPAYAVAAKRSLQFAMVVLFISGSFFAYKNFQNRITAPQGQYQTVTVDNGQRMDLSLDDGTHVILDAGSELKFPAKFKKTREVYLKGEAYFEVMHDGTRPFRVHANHATVGVVGTKFNIRAWMENPIVAVTVTEGTVTLGSRDTMDPKLVVIQKGYYSLLSEEGLPSTPTPIDVQSNLGWMHNEIRFEDASVREVLAQLERWYDFQFDIADHSIMEQRITVHIRMTNIDDVLELISILTETRIIKDNKIIKIRSKNLR